MSKLKIADDLSLPLDIVTQTVAVLAKRRAGKSYAMRRLVEQLLKAGQQVVLIDPKGDQWGLRSAANGKDPGVPIVILGGERGDVPLEPSSGEIVAKLVVEERVSALLDLSSFRKHEVATFMTSFMENLYRLKAREIYRTPMMLVIDEADAVAPQKPQKGEERMLGAAEDIVRRGGQRGIGCVLVTQRSAVLNKNVLTQAQVLVVLRTIAPQDLAAMKAWIDVHGDDEQGKTLMASLPSLPIGDAWVWSPGWPTTDGIFKRVHVLPIETFDSGASPKPGVKPVEPKNLADVDLEALKGQMAAAIEKKKADDPKELRKLNAEKDKRIKELEAALSNLAHNMREKTTETRVEVLTDADRELLRKTGTMLEQMAGSLGVGEETAFGKLEERVKAIVDKCELELGVVHQRARLEFERRLEAAGFQKIIAKLEAVQRPAPAQVTMRVSANAQPATRRALHTLARAAAIARPDVSRPPARAGDDHVGLSKMHRAMLTALAQHPDGLTKKQVLVHTGYASSGPVSKAFADLAREGWADMQGNLLKITAGGLQTLGPYDPLPVGDELREWLLASDKLSTMEKALLAQICRTYPEPARKGEILERANYASSGPVSAAFAKLVAYNYAVPQGPAMLKAAEELFG